MSNVFEAGIQSLLDAGEPMSSVLREFANAVQGHKGHYETGTLIDEIADVLQESEPPRRYGSDEESDEDED
jgi:hypothetical protein